MPLEPTRVTVDSIIADVSARIAEQPPAIGDLEAIWLIQLVSADQDGVRVVDREVHLIARDGALTFVDGGLPEDATATVVIVTSEPVLVGIATGQLSPAGALMRGQLEIDGPIALAMRLGNILSNGTS